MIWSIANNYVEVAGYSLEQMSLPSYSGAPAHHFWFDDYNGVGHGMHQLMNGDLILAVSDEGGGNEEESFILVEDPDTRRGSVSISAPGIRRLRCDSFDNWPFTDYGARSISEFLDGSVLLGRGGIAAKISADQLYGLEPHADAPVMRCMVSAAGFNGWDTIVTDVGYVWYGSDGDFFAAVEITDPDTDGEVAAVKVLDSGGAVATGGLAFDSFGGMWRADWQAGQLDYFNAATLGALTSTPSAPAATRSLTSSEFSEPGAVWFVTPDNEDGLWVCMYESPGRLLYFAPGKVTAGGEQDPDRIITLPFDVPGSVRLNIAVGPHR